MEEVRQLVQEEGREARNLVAFHVSVETPARISRKPPRVTGISIRRGGPRPARRSASAGRDKRSELRARYWALLFGDLQRAIGEIYNTVEVHENLNECQEVILVLENYTRDFKALGEWFRLKWEYDNTPPPQRPQSLAWEIRKTDFVRPESRRTYSVKSSPSVSGKNSPCFSGHNTPSGKNSPSLTGKASPGSGKISPRISSGHSSTSPKANIEFFSNKIIPSKVTAKPEPILKEGSRLSDIKEKDYKDIVQSNGTAEKLVIDNNEEKLESTVPVVEIGKAKECSNISPKQVAINSPKHAKAVPENKDILIKETASKAQEIIAKLDAMENEFLAKHIKDSQAKNGNLLNQEKEEVGVKPEIEITEKTITDNDNKDEKNVVDEKESEVSTESPSKSEDNFADISNESSIKSIDEKIGVVTNETKKLNSPDLLKQSFENVSLDSSSKANANVPNNEEVTDNSERVTQTPAAENGNKDTEQKCTENIQNKDSSKVVSTYESNKKVEIKSAPDSKPPTDTKLVTDNKTTSDPKLSARPAYSQAAAKPKPVTAKTEVKTPTRTTPLTRSKTVVEMRPNFAPRASRPFPKRNQVNQANKCSYPFNVTSRSSLFDTAPTAATITKGAIARKPPIKNIQMAAGDNKLQNKNNDIKKRPPRPTSLKITDKGIKKDNVIATLEKIKDCDEFSSSDTIVTQIDMSRIESSESLKTLVPEEMLQEVANSIEVLNVDGNKNDNDGWLTVKSRRLSRESKKQSKSHWANRFHQPSATTSLPTLNMIESPKQETNPIVNSPKHAKLDRAKSEQPQLIPKPEKVVKVSVKVKSEAKNKSTEMIRQKSDVTGLRTRSSRNKAFTKRAEKVKDFSKDKESSDLTKNRLHSSLESLTMGLARSQESTEDAFDFDKWKAEFKSTFKYLEEDDQMPNHNEILKAADPLEMSEIAEMTSQIEENEKKISWALDFQSEVDQRKLCEEEDLLNRQIMELQQVSDIDLDTETDDTETDAEILCEDTSLPRSCTSPDRLGALAASLEDQYETALAGMSWAERVDTLVVLEALVARDPGRAQQLHAKLSQGIKRRGSFQDALRRLQAKQARAERQRREYQTERAKKIHLLLARVEEVKVAKNQLIEEKRLRMERRLQKATENRDQRLKDIVRKAHDEEEKLREIAFIKQLEAENRRHDFLAQCRLHTTRLRQVRRDRLMKLEQKAAREAAVGARRQALEAARKLHVENLLEKRKERDARVEELKEQKKQERDDAAREKAEGVKSRLSALAAAAELEADALRSRIRDKQDASQQRLESRLQAIREKATRQPTTSESQDQATKEEKELAEEAERIELERKEREKQKAIKRKARKVKQKLLANGNDTPVIEDDAILSIGTFTSSNKMHKLLHTLTNIITPLLYEEPKKQKTKKYSGDADEKSNCEVDELKKVNGDANDEFNNNTETEIVVENHDKKKKKKDKPKLNKTSSVCSSLSDMSKGSAKSEKKKEVIDTAFLERQLNELHRMVDKFDRFQSEKLTSQKMQILRVLGHLIEIAAEREHLASQLSAKLLTTTVLMISRIVSACRLSASYFVSTNTCVRCVKLLCLRLEKDLHADQREMELSRQLCDCLSVALDSVLCCSRLYDDRRPSEDADALSALRNRAHTLISYLCLSGCITRAEKAGEARESVQTLLTVCAQLCHPCKVDAGSERQSATQSLRCALGTSLCGSRAEFCGLFARGAELSQSGMFVRAARTAHLLRALAELDHQLVQEAFGEGGWPLEFRAAVARLLSQHAPSDKEAPRSTALRLSNQRLDQTLSETMVLDLMVLVGFVIVNNPQMQETICDGWSVIKTLCTLPANWLVSKTHSHALLPTLIALCDRPSVADAIACELSVQMLDEYLESPEAQKVKLIQVIKQGRAKKTDKV
ncbi:S phase cyclin A-associated protein in the endoplasmic reticulum isoform X2 [Plodia interpunctella]|uniref:S phase cyclin A-associated protein in the endoplasmic reticulum isoform X2 n=1 Tax=Plodia interpunctella TaxID=58824 RepID=UPI002367BC2E|nr:S phase cyclin A-associated protein in the endoplasmic reticulum isoform X2 [Plodia interpunctella]